jgi:two-component system response regulator MtrA
MPQERTRETRPPLVVLIGEMTKDRHRIEDLLNVGSVVVLACDADAVRLWLPQALGLQEGLGLPRVVLRVDHLEIDLTERHVRWKGSLIHVTDLEFELLVTLARDPGRVISRKSLVETVWGMTFYGDVANLHSAVKRLRRKLRSLGVDLRIESVRGVGFRIGRRSGRLRRNVRVRASQHSR